MPNTKSSTEEMRSKAQAISASSNTMYQKLMEIKQVINNLEPHMNSEAGREVRTDINSMQGKFDEYKSIVNDYAEHLRKAADSIDDTEKTIANNEAQLKH